MKSLVLIIALTFIGFSSSAQPQNTFGIFPGTVEREWDYTEDLDMKVFISSNSALNQDIEYTILKLDMPQQWQDNLSTQFCDIQSCYDFRWFKVGDKKEMKLPANQKNGVMKVDLLLPFDTTIKVSPGSAEIALGFAVKGFPISDTLRFLVNKTANGIVESANQQLLNIQTLSNNALSVSVPPMTNRIAMYNVNGIKIEEYAINQADKALLDIEHIGNGIYFLQVLTSSGNVLTAPFVKH